MAAPTPRSDFLKQLEILAQHEVRFIVVGGIAAALAGAPIVTLDLDVVFETESKNISKLNEALGTMNARYRDPGGRTLRPDTEKLATFRLSLLETDLGYLDVLRSIGDGLEYEHLVERSHIHQVGELDIRVLDLEAVIESKRFADRPKDHAVLHVLVETLRLREQLREEMPPHPSPLPQKGEREQS